MTTKDNLYQAILEAPNNDELRLVYADWCEENGDIARAEFIRVQIPLDARSEYDEAYQELYEREWELRTKTRQWLDGGGEASHFAARRQPPEFLPRVPAWVCGCFSPTALR